MVSATLFFSSLTAVLVSSVEAVVVSRASSSVAPLPSSTTDAFTPFGWYSEAAYCGPSNITAWNCGVSCQENPSFIPTAAGGDGNQVQFWYVGYDPTLQTVVVAHQGTHPQNIINDLTDLDITKINFDSDLFPGLDPEIKAHKGFVTEQAATAQDVLSAVQSTLAQHNSNQITLVGHSMGGALSLLDLIYLNLAMPDVKMNFVAFGLPRVGNQAFADYVDSMQNVNVVHINNKEDFIPTLPGKFLGFVHPSGQIHIQDDNTWMACLGQENMDSRCSDADVSNIFMGKRVDHDGPYGPVQMHSTCNGLA